jgi:protoporphyrinogen oxidase
VRDKKTGAVREIDADYVFSTMPVKELIESLDADVPSDVRSIAGALQYRDFITVGLLLRKLTVEEEGGGLIKDDWIYVQEPDAKVGRIQIFNNWSPYMVKDPSTAWIGLEYFCTEGDMLWQMNEEEFTRFAIAEVVRIGIIEQENVLDSVVVKVKKTYPGYFGAYEHFETVRKYIDGYENLFLVGRNGMHKYNNQDHSMLTAMVAVDNIAAGRIDKENIWSINTESDYHEEKDA